MSKAQLSLESSQPSPSLPMQSGRKPSESRTPTISRSLRSTSENAPFTLHSAWIRLLSPCAAAGCAMRCRITSLSTVVLKMAPSSSSSSRRMWALTRLPLWPMAIWPARAVGQDGLRIFQRAGAGCGVTHVADGARSGQLGQFALVEDLRHQAHAVVRLEFAVRAAPDNDARAFLPAMLQGVEPVKGDFRRVGVVEDGEDAAFVPGAVLNDGLRRGGLMHSASTYTSSARKEKGSRCRYARPALRPRSGDFWMR